MIVSLPVKDTLVAKLLVTVVEKLASSFSAAASSLSVSKAPGAPFTRALISVAISVSTYAFTDCCVGTFVAEFEDILSSSTKSAPSNLSAFKFVTTVVEATVKGAVPVDTSDSKVCALNS